MEKAMKILKKLEIFDDDWTKKIYLLGVALRRTPTQELGIILFKSHGEIYGIKVDSDKTDLGFDGFINDTNYDIYKYDSIKELENEFKYTSFDTFSPLSNESKEIIISERDGWYNFKFVEILLDRNPNDFYSSIINIEVDIVDYIMDTNEFINNIYNEFSLDKIIEYNKTATNPIKVEINDKER